MTLILVAVLLAVSGVFRACHEAPMHDPDCGINRWATLRFEVSHPVLHQWLDSRYSSLNKYRMAEGKSPFIGWLLKGPLVCVTDFWHASYTISNGLYNVSFALVLHLLGLKAWIIVGLVLIDSSLFEPTYSALRAYVKK